MIKVSVLYPYTEDANFDMDYYLNQHIPMTQQKLGAALKGVSVEQGLVGATPGTPPAFVTMAHLLFDSAAAFQEAFGPHADQITGDTPNFTSIQPTFQISDVKM